MDNLEPDATLISQDKKNLKTALCPLCGCKLLKPNVGILVHSTFSLPIEKASAEQKTQTITWFLEVDDVFSYENIACTKTVENFKYLTCPDCERAVLGFQRNGEKNSFLALSRAQWT
eukprot:TRINITY_DN4022_c0_g1_i1.p1 TRINITY_DN4022_c0_g1~~TRINITY_DN4022_c0_g1_i1.p1  ORF type:complete len:128 (+),score=12.21 TRINITY_DN4022_c0_g1_i1:36-386(+)